MDYFHFMGWPSFSSGWHTALGLSSILILLTVLSTAWIYGLKAILKPLSKPGFWLEFLVSYPVWGVFQQAIIVSLYFWMEVRTGDPSFAMVAALMVFCALHTPNYHLLFSAGLMEAVVILFMREHHNLLAAGVLHGMAASCWHHFVPNKISTSFSVGPSYPEKQRRLTNGG